jgi:hypothetical protein
MGMGGGLLQFLTYGFYEKQNKKQIQSRPITISDKNIRCPITNKIININCKYIKCANCKCNYSIDCDITKCEICKSYINQSHIYINNGQNNLIHTSGKKKQKIIKSLDNKFVKYKQIYTDQNIKHIDMSIKKYTTVEDQYNSPHIQLDNIYYYYFITMKKLITNKNNECPISFDLINKGDKYYQCNTCKYNFSAEMFEYTSNIKNTYDNLSCPMCKSVWTNNCIYINTN